MKDQAPLPKDRTAFQTAKPNRVPLWQRFNPFRFVLRITEYLAGPPVYEELSSLQEHAERLRLRTSDLEVERDELNGHLSQLKIELERQEQQLNSLKKEKDELSDYAANLEKEREKIRHDAIVVEPARGHDVLRPVATPAVIPTVPRGQLRTLRDALEMQSGTFALLNQDGDDSGYGWKLLRNAGQAGDDRNSIFTLAQKAVYDSGADQVLFSGAQAANRPHTNRLLRYDVASNKWSVEQIAHEWSTGHAYDSNALNLGARELYVSAGLASNALRRMNLGTGTWSSMAHPSSIGFNSSEPSAEYFPDRDELLWLQTKRLGAWKRASNTWTLISPALTHLGWRSAIARYNPVHRCVLIVGGADIQRTHVTFSHAVYKYGKDGAVTRLKPSPASLKIHVNCAVVTVDPVSGDFIFIQAVLGTSFNDYTGQIEFWKYQVDTDTWTRMDESIIPAPENWWIDPYPSAVVATSLPKYRAMMFMSGAGSKSKVYVYKHA